MVKLITVIILSLCVAKSFGQCPAGTVVDTAGPCLPGLGCPDPNSCVGAGCTDPAQTCSCCIASTVPDPTATCPAGSASTGPCFAMTCPGATDTCVGTGCSDSSSSSCLCCSTSAVTVAATTVFGVTVTTSPTSSSSCTGPCIDGACPTGYTCDVTSNTCCNQPSTGCIGPCLDNTCPTGYTCQADCCTSSISSSTLSPFEDKIGPKGYSDCPARAFLCNNTLYYDLMTDQCPKTCRRSRNGTSTNIGGSTCVDKTRPNGISDCSKLVYLCNVTAYYDLMTQQCPKSCGRCNSTTITG